MKKSVIFRLLESMDEYILILELVSLKVHYVIWGQKGSSEEKDIDH